MNTLLKKTLRILLFPFSFIYGFLITLRNWFFEWGILKQRSFPIPLISVGNITVGGTGKTPHVEYLIQLLQKEGYVVGVLSRGYGRRTQGFVLATATRKATEIGDEPRQMKHKFPNSVLAVDENRCHGIDEMLKGVPLPDVILLDDAYQHRYVKPGLSILLCDYNRPLYKDVVFPAGRLREPASGRKRAHVVVVTKCPTVLSEQAQSVLATHLKQAHQELFFTTYTYAPLCPLDGTASLTLTKEHEILLVTGIASPQLIEKYLNQETLHKLTFPDHHSFSLNDYKRIENVFATMNEPSKIIVTTEKDAARFRDDANFPESLKTRVFVLPLSVIFLSQSPSSKDEQQNKFNLKILDYVRANKRNS